MDTGHVGVLAGEHAEGVVVAHVLLHDEGELGDVLEAREVVGVTPAASKRSRYSGTFS